MCQFVPNPFPINPGESYEAYANRLLRYRHPDLFRLAPPYEVLAAEDVLIAAGQLEHKNVSEWQAVVSRYQGAK